MRFLAITALLLLTLCVGCHKVDVKTGTPKCIAKQIKAEDSKHTGVGAKVIKYKFQGKDVYVLDLCHKCPDAGSEVLDSDCKSLGSLGGMIGNCLINGEDFSKAEMIETVWQKKK
ncbi:MAG: hypothetical protein EOP56_01955 [Sphingobacteriales bacterium]|nr:MAG: hypothetical protein EOP56_01955 [Sphingobacteriales bacterium]